MNNAQEALSALQAQTLEAINSGHAAATQAAEALSKAFATMTPLFPVLPEISGLGRAPAITEVFGRPADLVDSAYDFATSVLEFNKQFSHALVAASQFGTAQLTADRIATMLATDVPSPSGARAEPAPKAVPAVAAPKAVPAVAAPKAVPAVAAPKAESAPKAVPAEAAPKPIRAKRTVASKTAAKQVSGPTDIS